MVIESCVSGRKNTFVLDKLHLKCLPKVERALRVVLGQENSPLALLSVLLRIPKMPIKMSAVKSKDHVLFVRITPLAGR